MRPLRVCLLVILSLPLLSLAGTKEDLQALSRDVALLRDDLRTMQKTLSELAVVVNQILDSSNKNNRDLAVMDATFRDRLKELERTAAAPAAGVGAKVDQMASEFGGLKESVADLTARMGKLQQQILDLANVIKVMQAPPAPPPAAGGSPTAAGTPQVPAETLYANAMRDKSGGRLDLAIAQFQDYLKSYGSTELAPNAQFQIGEIYYSQADFENALTEFDNVLEKYPENNKTADAMYMKGHTLVKLGRRNDGAKEFRSLLARYPDSELAGKAKAALKTLGVSGAVAPARKKK